jgi:hypothetical protein
MVCSYCPHGEVSGGYVSAEFHPKKPIKCRGGCGHTFTDYGMMALHMLAEEDFENKDLNPRERAALQDYYSHKYGFVPMRYRE